MTLRLSASAKAAGATPASLSIRQVAASVPASASGDVALPGRVAMLNLVLVFGDIRKMREIAEGARNDDRFFGRQSAQHGIELAAGLGIGVALEGDAEAADVFDPLEHLVAFLLADGIAEDLPKQADVLDERGISRGFGLSRRGYQANRSWDP